MAKKRTFTNWRLGLIGVFVASIILYLPSLKGAAIWDDDELIWGSAFGTNSLISAFTHPFANYYRPLTSVSFVADSAYAHGIPFFYHQTNILLHAVTAVLVCLIVFVLTEKKPAAILGGLFFATQPMQVGATAWIGGRTDILSTLFLSVFILGMIRYHQTSKGGWLALSVFSFLFAAMSKEQVAPILLAVPISVFALGSGKWKDAIRICIPFGGALLVYLVLWYFGGPVPQGATGSKWIMFDLGLRSAAHYGLAFLSPNPKSLITFTLEHMTGVVWWIVGAAIIGAAGYLMRLAWQKNRTLAWIAICGLLVYLPVSNYPPVPSLVVGPYRVASTGIAVACLLGIACSDGFQSKKYWLTGLTGANLVVGAVMSWWAIHLWLTPIGFWKAVFDNDPHFVSGTQFYSKFLQQAGKTSQAVDVCNQTISWIMDTPQWIELLEAKKESAITPEVVARLRINGGRENVQPFGNFIGSDAYYLARANRVVEARRVARVALYVSPKDAWINYLYGRLIRPIDRPSAIHYWETAMKLNPNYADCEASLGHERVLDHNYKDAIKLLQHSLKINDSSGRAWTDLADAKIAVKDFKGALSALDKAEHVLFAMSKPEIEKRRRLISSQLPVKVR